MTIEKKDELKTGASAATKPAASNKSQAKKPEPKNPEPKNPDLNEDEGKDGFESRKFPEDMSEQLNGNTAGLWLASKELTGGPGGGGAQVDEKPYPFPYQTHDGFPLVYETTDDATIQILAEVTPEDFSAVLSNQRCDSRYVTNNPSVTGTITHILQPSIAHDMLLASALMTPEYPANEPLVTESSSGWNAGVKKHFFDIHTSNALATSADVSNLIGCTQMKDAICSQWSLNIPVGGWSVVTANILSLNKSAESCFDEEGNANGDVLPNDEKSYGWADISFSNETGDGVFELNPSLGNCEIMDCTITINNNLSEDRCWGNGEKAVYTSDLMEVTVVADVAMFNNTATKDFLTENGAQGHLVLEAHCVFDGAGSKTYVFDMPAAIITDVTNSGVAADTLRTETITWTAYAKCNIDGSADNLINVSNTKAVAVAAPNITSHPIASSCGSVGSLAGFQLVAAGVNLSYQWYQTIANITLTPPGLIEEDGKMELITSDDDLDNYAVAIGGERDSSFLFEVGEVVGGVTIDPAKGYFCIVTNDLPGTETYESADGLTHIFSEAVGVGIVGACV